MGRKKMSSPWTCLHADSCVAIEFRSDCLHILGKESNRMLSGLPFLLLDLEVLKGDPSQGNQYWISCYVPRCLSVLWHFPSPVDAVYVKVDFFANRQSSSSVCLPDRCLILGLTKRSFLPLSLMNFQHCP